MTNFGWIKTKNQEARDWTTFSNGDVIATDDDIERLIKGSAKEDDIDEFIVGDNELYHLPTGRKVIKLNEGLLFKKLYSVMKNEDI